MDWHAAVDGGKRETFDGNDQPARLFEGNPDSPLLVVCDHASAYIPPRFKNLGVDPRTLASHAAYDIGALGVAREFSGMLDSPLVVSGVSRLVIDCNRSPDDEQSMPSQSEIFHIPGNRNIAPADRRDRIENIYQPFHDLVEAIANEMKNLSVMVSIHTFTPVFFGKRRQVDIGLLYDQDRRLAEKVHDIASQERGVRVALNQPYTAQGRFGHTMQRHADPRGLPHLAFEIRNDWVREPTEQVRWGRFFAGLMLKAVDELAPIVDSA
ncbi:MAG: N-formylglutamate amidohydrolase [Rhodobacteraceae bacterium]|nr:N-formylglutamate amidohydrolase [Paracoccaceae bacterium]